MFERRFWNFWRLQIRHMCLTFHRRMGKHSIFSRKYRFSLFQKSHLTGMARSLAFGSRWRWFLHQKTRAHCLQTLANSPPLTFLLPIFREARVWKAKKCLIPGENLHARSVGRKRVANTTESKTNLQDFQAYTWKSEIRVKMYMSSSSISSYRYFAEWMLFCSTIFHAPKIREVCFRAARSPALELRFQ